MAKSKVNQYFEIQDSFYKSLIYKKMVYADNGGVDVGEIEGKEVVPLDYTLFDLFFSLLVASISYEGFVFRDQIKGPLTIEDLAFFTFSGLTGAAAMHYDGQKHAFYSSFKLDEHGKLSQTETEVTLTDRCEEITKIISIGAIVKIDGENGGRKQYAISHDIEGLKLVSTTPAGFRQWKYRQKQKRKRKQAKSELGSSRVKPC
jgi:hypothetical protein